jgi:hypothetical protein
MYNETSGSAFSVSNNNIIWVIFYEGAFGWMNEKAWVKVMVLIVGCR